ncbi:MAG: 3-methyl-2-oxobutanoate hydroxymethyltransferase [Gammaproteobacteria bacterium]|nr:3-methyl-2-oxobutanoate hydroxymethyltransferase [Gammaproteobacteria bacterium]
MNQSVNALLSINDIRAMKRDGEKITCLTAYDASFAALLDRSGIDVLLVGDSLGMVVQGHRTTIPVSIADMLYHTRCVNHARERAFLIADLPFMSYSNPIDAAKNAALLLQQGGAQMVKLEGARLDCIRFLVEQKIPVCGHLGLLPQSIHQLGGYQVQGKEPDVAQKIREDAQLLQESGATMLILECVPAALAKQISNELIIPVIGIGAGVDCDGQVLVLYDMLGISFGKRPRFSKNFLLGEDSIESAIHAYRKAVKNAEFPAPEHCY